MNRSGVLSSFINWVVPIWTESGGVMTPAKLVRWAQQYLDDEAPAEVIVDPPYVVLPVNEPVTDSTQSSFIDDRIGGAAAFTSFEEMEAKVRENSRKATPKPENIWADFDVTPAAREQPPDQSADSPGMM